MPHSGVVLLGVRPHTGKSVVNLNQLTLPTTDIERSTAFYRAMGFTQIVAAPHYARFECPDGDATFSVHLVESVAQNSGVVVYFECEALDAIVAQLQSKGFTFTKAPTDERWLWREARLTDPDGNVICLYHAGSNRKYPPWRVGVD
jgi:predicted enzyme related to lactoylglutathione lyase